MIKKSFRGILAGLAVCTCLSVSAKGASAEEIPTNEGGIDLDALIAQEETGSFLIDDTNNNARAARVAAGGGTFNVYWDWIVIPQSTTIPQKFINQAQVIGV